MSHHILYIFPHPDDESFGPAPAIARQKRQGHRVSLLTLTKGGATKVRHDLGLSVEAMGELRHKEMLRVEAVLDLDEMTVLDFPDSGLADMDPRPLEAAVREHIQQLRPDVIVTYAVHGISGFHDHLVAHAVVKRVFCELRDQADAGYAPKRLALFTMGQADAEQAGSIKLNHTPDERIDAVEFCSESDMAVFNKALDCYETYAKTIEDSRVREVISRSVRFELFQESFDPPLDGITAGL